MDELAKLLTPGTAAWGATTILALVVMRLWSSLPQLLDKWLAFRSAKSAERAADWTRLRDEVIRLGAGEARCRQELADVTRRLAQLEGFAAGRGEARQEAAIIESARRIVDRSEE